MLTQINQSLELQRDTIEKHSSLALLENQVIPNINIFKTYIEEQKKDKITKNKAPDASKWDAVGDDVSPSPPRSIQRSTSPPNKLAKKLGMMDSMIKKETPKKKKKKSRDKSQSDDSSSSDSSSMLTTIHFPHQPA